jgi:hypothetical protein
MPDYWLGGAQIPTDYPPPRMRLQRRLTRAQLDPFSKMEARRAAPLCLPLCSGCLGLPAGSLSGIRARIKRNAGLPRTPVDNA